MKCTDPDAVGKIISEQHRISGAYRDDINHKEPIVATDCPCGGPRTIMTNEVDGLLIPIKDQKALEEGINRLIEEPQFAERLGMEARKIAERAAASARSFSSVSLAPIK